MTSKENTGLSHCKFINNDLKIIIQLYHSYINYMHILSVNLKLK